MQAQSEGVLRLVRSSAASVDCSCRSVSSGASFGAGIRGQGVPLLSYALVALFLDHHLVNERLVGRCWEQNRRFLRAQDSLAASTDFS